MTTMAPQKPKYQDFKNKLEWTLSTYHRTSELECKYWTKGRSCVDVDQQEVLYNIPIRNTGIVTPVEINIIILILNKRQELCWCRPTGGTVQHPYT